MLGKGCRQISLQIYILYPNEAHKQYSLLDTIFDYIFYFGPPGTHFYLSPQNHYMSAGEADRHVVGFLDLFIDIFLEVQDKR